MTVIKLLGIAAVGAMLAIAAPSAQAMSLASPGAAATVGQDAAAQETARETTEVRYRGGYGGYRRYGYGGYRRHGYEYGGYRRHYGYGRGYRRH
jgi:hypothetical protein